jgi:hypothetical protein
MLDFNVGDEVEFDEKCPCCERVVNVISGRIIDYLPLNDTGIQKVTVNTGKKYTGTNRDILYSISLERLRLKERIVPNKRKIISIRIRVDDVLDIHPDWTESQATEYVRQLGDKFRKAAEDWEILMLPTLDA